MREQLIQENKKLILPMYKRFHERYTVIEFSKNPEKHMRYTPIALEETLEKFFDSRE